MNRPISQLEIENLVKWEGTLMHRGLPPFAPAREKGNEFVK